MWIIVGRCNKPVCPDHLCQDSFAPQHVQNYSLLCFTWLAHICDAWHDLFVCWHDESMNESMKWLIMSTYERHVEMMSHFIDSFSHFIDSFMMSHFIWLIMSTYEWHVEMMSHWDMTQSYAQYDSLCVTIMCVLWLIHVCVMTHLCVCHDSFMCVSWLMLTFAPYCV